MHGVKVVDFGIFLAGPLVARMLCDEGAEVTHVDAPGVEHSPTSAVLNRGKTRVQLDLKSKAGLASALDLVRNADVVVNNFRPGVMQRLGLGAEHCKAINPTVIYLSLPGFASTDSQLADVRAFEGLMLAGSGVYSDMGLNRVLRGVNPSYSPLALASCYSSVMGGIGVSLALYNRDRNGLGDVIEVPLTSGLMDGLVYNSLDVAELPERYMCVRVREIARREEEGLPMNLSYEGITHMVR
jgi:crotonobetainyl-CoA:carnitine CoA-transferase CaiB-like acyl-CoA transferase